MGRAVIDPQSDAELAGWCGKRDTFGGVIYCFEVAVHEGTHKWDLGMLGATWSYRVRDDLVIRARRLRNFAISEILQLHADVAKDQFADLYLSGPTGTQGFNYLLEEYNAYVHTLATRYCTQDGIADGVRVNGKDGILTFMYYLELYLRRARTAHPDDYAAIKADPEQVRLILTVWDRAELWLAKAADRYQLGIDDAVIRRWTYDPQNLAEIRMLKP